MCLCFNAHTYTTLHSYTHMQFLLLGIKRPLEANMVEQTSTGPPSPSQMLSKGLSSQPVIRDRVDETHQRHPSVQPLIYSPPHSPLKRARTGRALEFPGTGSNPILSQPASMAIPNTQKLAGLGPDPTALE